MADSIVARLSVLLTTNQAEFGKAMQQNSNALKAFEKSLRNVNTVLSSFGLAISAVAIFQVFRDAVGTIADFEKEMSTVKAITGATGKDFDRLRDSALKLGASTKFTAQEVAKLQVEYGRLGFTTEEILAAEKATLQLATATGEDLAKSADVAGSTVRGFGLNASETQRVVDVMAESFNRTALSLENFRESMKYVAPIANVAGASVEETTALLGVLADAGIRGSNAGTALRKIFTDIAKDGRPLQERLKELAAKGVTLSSAMDEVGRTAQTALIVLTKNTEKTDELTASLNNAAGAGERAAAIMSDNLTGDVEKLSGAYDSLVLSNNAATSVLREFVQALTSVLNALNTNNGALGEYIQKWLKLALIVPRTTAKIVDGIGQIFSGTAKLSDKQVQETLETLNNLRNEAKLKGNQEDVVRYTQLIADLTAMYGLLKDKAVEFKEENKKALDDAKISAVGLIQSLEDRIKILDEKKKAAFSVEAVAKFNAEIEKLRTQLEFLNNIESPKALEQFRKAQAPRGKESLGAADKKTGDDTSRALGVDIEALEENSRRAGEAISTSMIKATEGIDSAILANQLLEESMLRTAETAVAISDIIGSAIGEAFTGADSGVQSLKKATIAIIDLFYKQALAAAIAKAVQSKGPLPVALIAAGVGIAAVKALFAKNVGKTGGGGGSAQSAQRPAARETVSGNAQDVQLSAETVIRGQDLFVVLKNYESNNRSTRING